MEKKFSIFFIHETVLLNQALRPWVTKVDFSRERLNFGGGAGGF